jgi:RNA polymerase sigma-70 factor (ECF subfamily)
MVTKAHLSEKAQHDFTLIEKAKKGDQIAYADLVDRYRDSIYYMLLKMVNNKNDAEDLTIEAFGKAFNNIDQYTPTYAFSTWLFKIATNNCIDFIRRKKENNVSLDKAGAEFNDKTNVFIKDEGMDPEEHLINKQKVKMMRAIIKKLKPHYQQLIELRYFKEYSYYEISEKLDLPLGTIKAQLFRARELLYNIMKKTAQDIAKNG